MRKILGSMMLVGVALATTAAGTATGSVVIPVSNGTVSFDATFTISGDNLTLVLRNTSASPSSDPNQVLTSFYFDIKKTDATRPTLANYSATGQVWDVNAGTADVNLGSFNLATSLSYPQSTPPVDDMWEFKSGLNVSENPYQFFGVGTAGNNSGGGIHIDNTFNGNVVDGLNLGIYVGDSNAQNLDKYCLVRDQATFTWTGVSGFTDADISRSALFGTGTAPDILLWNSPPIVPEPASLAIWSGLGLVGLIAARRRKRAA